MLAGPRGDLDDHSDLARDDALGRLLAARQAHLVPQDDAEQGRNVDFETGKPDDTQGLTLRPQDIHATRPKNRRDIKALLKNP